MNIYKEVGCSQEHHLDDCSHFGYAGTYLSEHAPECTTQGRTGPCICNPQARKNNGKTFTHPHINPFAKVSEAIRGKKHDLTTERIRSPYTGLLEDIYVDNVDDYLDTQRTKRHRG